MKKLKLIFWVIGILLVGGRRNLAAFLRFKGRVAAITVEVRDVAKSSKNALVKRFCEKNFTEFLARVEKMVGVFLSSPTPSVRIDDF